MATEKKRALPFVRRVQSPGFIPLEEADLAGDATEEEGRLDLDYEVPQSDWSPHSCPSTQAAEPPSRFIDGGLATRLVASVTGASGERPLLLSSLGAIEVAIENDYIKRRDMELKTVCFLPSFDVPENELVEIKDRLEEEDVELRDAPLDSEPPYWEVCQRRAWDAARHYMRDLERKLLLQSMAPALADGALDQSLVHSVEDELPAVGMVKSVRQPHLSGALRQVMYRLHAGERTPAYTRRTERVELVNWYLRLEESPEGIPGFGVIRLSMARRYLESRFPDKEARSREIDGISNFVRRYRHREESYRRMAISIEPIVRAEELLHAAMADLDEKQAHLHHALRI